MEVVGIAVPELSLSIIVAGSGTTQILDCLHALYAQAQSAGAEIIVAAISDGPTYEGIRRDFPAVRILATSQSLPLPELRTMAIAIARGDVIAILDIFSIVNDDWVPEVLRAHREHSNLAIGGAVELYDAERQDLLSWAMYINEYGMFMLPREPGEVEILPGSNISYKREALFDRGGPKHQVFWKTFVNQELEAGGHALWLDPKIVVHLKKAIPIGDFFRTRYDHGRCFAGMRGANLGFGRRLIHAITFPALPFIFIWRWGAKFWVKRRFRSKFVTTLPFQLLLFGSWAVGEFIGYIHGPGDSCQALHY